MGLVYNIVTPEGSVSRVKKLVQLTSRNIKFLRSLGFKVKDVKY